MYRCITRLFFTRLCNHVCEIQKATVCHIGPHAIHDLAPEYYYSDRQNGLFITIITATVFTLLTYTLLIIRCCRLAVVPSGSVSIVALQYTLVIANVPNYTPCTRTVIVNMLKSILPRDFQSILVFHDLPHSSVPTEGV